MPNTAAKAFLSYAHADNDREAGRILHLADLIRNEFETLTGETIEIFTDNPEILWGDDFRERLDQALQETTFFIPVLTPTYFLREECRREMSQFVSSARSLGLRKLLLSIRYIPVQDLREDSSDELKAVAARMQYEPWDQLRLQDELSAPYRVGVNRLAQRLVDLTHELEVAPHSHDSEEGVDNPEEAEGRGGVYAHVTTPLFPSDAADEVDDEDAPGLIDLVVDAEPAMHAWAATLTRLQESIGRFNAVIADGTRRMNESNNRPNAFAAKIRVAKELAVEIEEPLQEVEELSKEYSTGLLRLDPPVRAMLQMASAQPSDESTTFIGSINTLVENSRTAAESLRTAADAARTNAGMSRDLRPVLRRFETALRNLIDAGQILDEWHELAARTSNASSL